MTTATIEDRTTSDKDLDFDSKTIRDPQTSTQIDASSSEVNLSIDLREFVSPLLTRQIEELAGLEENWNSYGAQPVKKEVINRAKRLIENIDFGHYPLPSFCPVATGGLDIDWDLDDKFLSFKLRDHENRYFFADRVSGKREGQVIRNENEFVHLLDLLKNE